MQNNNATEQMLKYWHVIHWDATSFLTLHDNYNSQLFYDRITSNLIQDLVRGLRGIAGGIARSLLGFFSSILRRRSPKDPSMQPYMLLITVGGPKYASEEKKIVELCRDKGLTVSVVYSLPMPSAQSNSELLSVASTLLPRDHIWVLSIWLWKVIGNFPWLSIRDKKQRNLFVAAIPAIRQYYIYVALARRIIANQGTPHLLISLLPSSQASITIIDHMKMRGVLTAAIRTQATLHCIEHLVINADILFCKSLHERRVYEGIFAGKGPRLEAGCLLSLPEILPIEPLCLPKEYVLLIGTAPTTDENDRNYYRFNEKLFQVAAATKLPIVFKGHNLAQDLDEAWFASGRAGEGPCLRIADIHRNRELIDHASLVVSAPSTLLYYVILCGKPLIIVDSKIISECPDEFQTAPITRIAWHQTVALDHLDWNVLRDSCHAAKSWFEENYCLQKGPDYILDFLLGEAELAPAPYRCGANRERSTQV
jgi:hypothetical protein